MDKRCGRQIFNSTEGSKEKAIVRAVLPATAKGMLGQFEE